MTSPADALRQAGEALYGPRFVVELARTLAMSDRHMRRLLAGTHEPPPSLLEEVWALLEARKPVIGAAQAALGMVVVRQRDG